MLRNSGETHFDSVVKFLLLRLDEQGLKVSSLWASSPGCVHSAPHRVDLQ